ncbi:MAG: hypothetical protein V4687_08090 [Bacteroidota bacterium]
MTHFRKHIALVIICFVLSLSSAYAQLNVDSVKIERVHIQTDRSSYSVGDTIWYKAYVTAGATMQPTRISKVLYVDLIEEPNIIAKSVNLEIVNGTATGNFILTSEFKAGTVRLVSYTKWMKNFSSEYFFDRTIRIGASDAALVRKTVEELNEINSIPDSEEKDKTGQKRPILKEIDLQFLPEGGHALVGVQSRIGFKAIGVSGFGVAVNGIVVDEKGQQITTIKDLRYGMGSFLYTPKAGIDYYALINWSKGTEKKYKLPTAKNDGFGLAVVQDKDSLKVKLYTAKNTDQAFRGQLKLKVLNETMITRTVMFIDQQAVFSFAKNELPYGICQISLLDERGRILLERAVFVKNNKRMQMLMSVNQPSYSFREQTRVSIVNKVFTDADVLPSFSVSVSRLDSTEAEEPPSIFTSLLLSSELQGYIEQPNYYFNTEGVEVDEALDNLMLTQGYRNYVLPEASLIQPPEARGMGASGVVRDLENRLAANARVTLLSLNGGIMEDVMTDKQGRFNIDGLNFLNGVKFSVVAKYPDRKDRLKVVMTNVSPSKVGLNRNWPVSQSIVSLLTNKSIPDSLPKQDKDARSLKEVNIKKQVAPKIKYAQQGMFTIPEGSSDLTVFLDKPELCSTLANCLRGKLGGVVFGLYRDVQNYPYSRDSAMRVFVNGRQVTDMVELSGIFDNNTILPEDIGRIEVVRTNQALISTLGGPSLLILTKRKNLEEKIFIPNYTYYLPEGYTESPAAYVPRFKVGKQFLPSKVVYAAFWDGKMKFNNKGEIALDFGNFGTPGKYQIKIEGINASGHPGSATLTYVLK